MQPSDRNFCYNAIIGNSSWAIFKKDAQGLFIFNNIALHFSNENDDGQPKVWYKMSRLTNSTPHEVDLGMNSNLTANRKHVNTEHTLIIHNFTSYDIGLYYCLGLEGQERENKYNFLVDCKFLCGQNYTYVSKIQKLQWFLKTYLYPTKLET